MYTRVAPRDLFNEANYIKCIAQISLLLHDYPKPNVRLELDVWHTKGMDLDQTVDGELFDYNISLVVFNYKYAIYRPLNSREPYPIYIYNRRTQVQIEIFNEDGSFSKEFLTFIGETN